MEDPFFLLRLALPGMDGVGIALGARRTVVLILLFNDHGIAGNSLLAH